MGRTQTVQQAAHHHRRSPGGSPFLGIMVGTLVVLPFWIVVAWLVWALT